MTSSDFTSSNNNNNKSIYIASWFKVTLFKGAVTSKKNSKKSKGNDIKICNIFFFINNQKEYQ